MSSHAPSSLRTLRFFWQTYPMQSLLVIGAFILAGFAETLGISALLPLVNVILGQGGEAAAAGTLEATIQNIFAYFHLTPNLETLLIVLVIAISVKAVIIFSAVRYVGFIASDIAQKTRMRLILSLMGAKWSYYSSMVTGHISNAISEQGHRAGHCYMMAGRTAAAFVQVIIYLSFAFLVSVQVSLLAIVFGSTLAFCLKAFIRMGRNASQNMTSSMDIMLARLNEALVGAKPIKAMAHEERFIHYLENDTKAVCEAQKKQYAASQFIVVIYEPIIIFIMACGLYYIITYANMPVNSVLLLAFLFHRLMGYVSTLQSYYQSMVQSETALWSLVDQSKRAEQEAEIFNTGTTPDLAERIEFKNISITYNGADFLFEDFNATIPAHQITLLYGVSGIGKTTLTDAILGLHTPHSGEIFIDGTPLAQVDTKQWREQVGYVPQDTFLFHASIADNITLGEEKYSEDDITSALKQAAAWAFVKDMDGGIHYIVGERGGRLSGGQRQRIALARSLIRKPKLLILDEATTGLDAKSEEEVFKSIAEIREDTTIILISHNPKLKTIADRIIEL